MKRYACLLRGINVSGQRKITMKDLCSACEKAGFSDVEYYLQSGNIILGTKLAPGAVTSLVKATINDEFGYDDVDVIVLTVSDLNKIVKGLPKGWAGFESKMQHFTFLSSQPAASVIKSLDTKAFFPDEYSVEKSVVYVHCPNGYGRTKLNNSYFEKLLGVRATTRNWNTTHHLLEMLTLEA